MKKGKTSRRTFLKESTISTTAMILSPGILASCKEVGGSITKLSDITSFDSALRMMSDVAPLGNHGPMAAEALVSLGRADALAGFVKSFLNEFSSKFPPKKERVNKDNWQNALSDGGRIKNWIEFFEQELKVNDWKKIVDKWSNRLAPGLSAAAAHGLIRTGHAVRSLITNENDLRKNELAQALGYWAAHYQELPDSRRENALKLSLPEAVKQIPVLLPGKARLSGNIVSRLKNLKGFSDFKNVTSFVEINGDADKVLSELTGLFAEDYLKKVDGKTVITLIHIITSLTAVRSLLPVLSDDTIQKMMYYGWQAAAALSSISGGRRNQLPADTTVDQDELVDRAVLSNEVHAIKFTEACLREYKLNPSAAYLLAAKDAVDRLV